MYGPAIASVPRGKRSLLVLDIQTEQTMASSAKASARASAKNVQYVLVDSSQSVHSTTSDVLKQEPPDQESSPSGKTTRQTTRRDVLIRQPSYCKILDDLTGGAEAAMAANKRSDVPAIESSSSPPSDASRQAQSATPQPAAIQTITINGQQYQIVSPASIAAAAESSASSSSAPPGVVQYAATSQNGQTVFIPGTVATAAGATQMIAVSAAAGTTSAAAAAVAATSASPNGVTEEAVRKREIRLLKNREAARECRNKKKEYIKCLENRVAVLENQNKALIEELKSLKELYTGQKS